MLDDALLIGEAYEQTTVDGKSDCDNNSAGAGLLREEGAAASSSSAAAGSTRT